MNSKIVNIGTTFEFIRNGKSIKQNGKKGLPITRIETIANGVVDFKKMGYANIRSIKGYEQYLMKNGDILMSHINSEKHLGKVAIFIESTPVIHGMNLLCLRTNNNLNSKFAFYFFRSSNFTQQISKITKKSVNQASFSVSAIKSLKIPLPPLETQKRIVALLDRAQALIDKRKEQIALMDQLIRSLFYDMFGDPVTNPLGWEETTIGDTCYFVKDGPHTSLEYIDSGIPFVSVKDIINGSWNFSNSRYISQEVFDLYKKRCQPGLGDILYTKGGTTGFAKYVDIDIDFLNWVHIAVLKFDKSIIVGKFYESMLNSQYCYKQSQRYTRGIANRDLVLGQMKKIKHYLPPINLQNTFVYRVKKIETQKQAMTTSLHELENNFNSLMQRSFKGEI